MTDHFKRIYEDLDEASFVKKPEEAIEQIKAADWQAVPYTPGIYVSPDGLLHQLHGGYNWKESGAVAARGPYLPLDTDSFWQFAENLAIMKQIDEWVDKEAELAGQVAQLQAKLDLVKAALDGKVVHENDCERY